MWISSVTMDINVFAQHTDSIIDALALLNEKKDQLKEIDGNGRCIAGFENPEIELTPPSVVENLIIKRMWNTQSAAAEYASFVQNLNVGFNASIEEQV